MTSDIRFIENHEKVYCIHIMHRSCYFITTTFMRNIKSINHSDCKGDYTLLFCVYQWMLANKLQHFIEVNDCLNHKTPLFVLSLTANRWVWMNEHQLKCLSSF